MKISIEILVVVIIGITLSIITAGPWDDLYWENIYLESARSILSKIFTLGFLVVIFASGGPHGASLREITISGALGVFLQFIIMHYVIRLGVITARIRLKKDRGSSLEL